MSIFALCCFRGYQPVVPPPPKQKTPAELVQEGYGYLYEHDLEKAAQKFELAAIGGNEEGAYQCAEAYAKLKKFDKAKPWYEKISKSNPFAALKLGILLEREDPEKAYRCYVMAYSLPEGKFNCGRMFYEGKGTRQDFQQASTCFEEARIQEPLAHYYLGLMTILGQRYAGDVRVASDILQGVKLIRDAALLQCDFSHKILLELFDYDYAKLKQFLMLIPSDNEVLQIGIKLLEKGARNKHPDACCALGYHNAKNRNYQAAADWFQEARKHGHLEASYELGKLVYSGTKVLQNLPLAKEIFEVLDQKNDSRASYFLALMYYKGQGVALDVEKALGYYLKACNQGHPQARLFVASALIEGKILQRDIPKAIQLLNVIAELDKLPDQEKERYLISIKKAKDKLLLLFIDVKQSFENNPNDLVLPILILLSEHLQEAQLYLGIYYLNKDDLVEAARFFVKTERSLDGHHHMNRLIEFAKDLLEGKNVPQDKVKAIKILNHLALKKLDAQMLLGRLFFDERNYAKAFIYYERAYAMFKDYDAYLKLENMRLNGFIPRTEVPIRYSYAIPPSALKTTDEEKKD